MADFTEDKNKIKTMSKLLTIAVDKDDDLMMAKLTAGLMMEYSKLINGALYPMITESVPYAVAMLELYAESLRARFPDCVDLADALKKVPKSELMMYAGDDDNG